MIHPSDTAAHDLMLHVERIVRPVAATERRKLRMRVELLAHLEAALEEEQRDAPLEPAALIRAKRRLGEPVELTQTLQRTVPRIERFLLRRIPTSTRVDRLERRLALLPGQRGPMTLAHKTALLTLAALSVVPLLLLIMRVTTRGVPAAHVAFGLVGIGGGGVALLVVFCRFIFDAASEWPRWRSHVMLASAYVATHLALVAGIPFAVADRQATLPEMAAGTFAIAVVLAVSAIVARRVAALRRAYDPWLSLDA